MPFEALTDEVVHSPICTHNPVVGAPLITKRAAKGGSSVGCEGGGGEKLY